MSRNLERALETLDVGNQTPASMHAGCYLPTNKDGRCWRCLRNKSRVPGEDFTCEPCFAYLTGETDDDPKTALRAY